MDWRGYGCGLGLCCVLVEVLLEVGWGGVGLGVGFGLGRCWVLAGAVLGMGWGGVGNGLGRCKPGMCWICVGYGLGLLGMGWGGVGNIGMHFYSRLL